MSTFTLAISCLTTSNIPGSYAILLFIALDLASVTSHIHNWVLCLLWLHPFILSGVISPLISSSILATYRLGEFIFQCPIFFAFSYCSCGSQGKNTEVVFISFSSGQCYIRTLHHDLSILGGPTQHGS